MEIKNFETMLSEERVRKQISKYAGILSEQLEEFAKKEMADFGVDYQTAFNRFIIFKIAEDWYRQHVEAVAGNFPSQSN